MKKKQVIYCISIIALVLLSIIPLLLISGYNHPSADDYSYPRECYKTWKATHSLFKVLGEAVATDIRYWNSWQGLYLSAFLLALCPSIFGEKYYALTGFILIGSLLASTLGASFYIFTRKLKQPGCISLALGCIVLFPTLQFMPSVTEGLYWYNGAMNYTFPYAILLLFICLLIGLNGENRKGIRLGVYTLFTGIVAFILEGGNHVTTFMAFLCFIGFCVWILMKKEYRKLIRFGFVGVALITGILLNFLAPGTSNRQSLLSSPGFFKTLINVPFVVLKEIGGWMNLSLLIILVLLFPIAVSICRNLIVDKKFEFKHPWIVFVLSLCWLGAMACPSYYAMGLLGAGRLVNLIYFSFVWLVVINYIYIIGWGMRTLGLVETDAFESKAFVGIIIASVLSIIAIWNTSYSSVAVKELKTGVAQGYSHEAYVRYELYRNPPDMDLIVDPFTQTSEILFYDDIRGDTEDWRNNRLSRYYGLNSVKLRE